MKREPLTQDEVDGLPPGSLVEVIWSGGNGPHRHRIVRDQWGGNCADNTYRDRLRPVGERPLTEVRLIALRLRR